MKIQKKSTKNAIFDIILTLQSWWHPKMPTTHIKYCKRTQFNTICDFESFYYASRGKNMVSGDKNCNFDL